MRKYWIVTLIVLPLVAWSASSPTDWARAGFFEWREYALAVSGLVTFTLCSACMALATRWSWLERRLGGLDRMYRLHKALASPPLWCCSCTG
jgi:predicted ferric reductase